MAQSLGKVKAFSLGVKNKKEVEKQKKQADEEAAAQAYEQFVATFDAPKPTGKLFVRGNELEKKQKQFEARPNDDNKATKPPAAFNPKFNEKPPKKKGDVKKKSNLEAFKEELKLMQKEREARLRQRTTGKDGSSGGKPFKSTLYDDDPASDISRTGSTTTSTTALSGGSSSSKVPGAGSHDTGDPNTTNIYLGNLNPKLTEDQLCEVFGRYGPLASVKIMWPRTDEERTRNRNCGFVAFMCRKDGERAMRAINGRPVLDFEMRLGWGKSVPIPATPIYVPPALRELTVPPPLSGLPFNAQLVDEKDRAFLQQYGGDPKRLYREDKAAFEDLLSRTLIKVVTPTERPVLATIHRVVEFVVREGPMFEALLMAREASNPLFAFLFDNQSPNHLEEFRMFEGGSLWRPPPISLYLQGMPEELLPPESDFGDLLLNPGDRRTADSDGGDSGAGGGSGKSGGGQKKGLLREADREDFEDWLRSLTPQRSKIAHLMVFCIEHADAWEEIIECIADSLFIAETPLFKKVARLYLISDILNNCTVKVANASNYRRGLQAKLVPIFEAFHRAYAGIEGRLKAEQFKQRVMSCFRAWEDTAIFSSEFLIKLQNVFLGLDKEKKKKAVEVTKAAAFGQAIRTDDELDGIPLDPDLDGEELPFPQETTATRRSSQNFVSTKFKPSKWETIDPEVVESQAITTSKWEHLDRVASAAAAAEEAIYTDEDIDGKPMDDDEPDYFEAIGSRAEQGKASASSSSSSSASTPLEPPPSTLTASSSSSVSLSREVLREIELKVIQYQDDRESDRRSGRLKVVTDEELARMVGKYREELMRKAAAANSDQQRPFTSSSTSRTRSRSRSRSPPRLRHSSTSSSTSSSAHHHYTSKSRYSRSPPPRRPSRSRSPPSKRWK
ncbi:U2 snRNP-associated SURP domain-containing protein [Tyrophagus putrescentiae]|nr:U2 snRNP-associated SURP domain-containing protein [Tyrophagus putrescentiae]